MKVGLAVQVALLSSALFALSGCETPPRPIAPVAAPAPSPEPAPEWRHTATRDFERDYPGRGLGISRRFDSEDGWIDVYVYDLGRTWVDGCADPQFAEAFASACDDVRAAARAGHYAELKTQPPTDDVAGTLPLRIAGFSYVHQGRKLESYVLMTCARGRVLKARASLFVPVSSSARESVLALVRQQVRLIN